MTDVTLEPLDDHIVLEPVDESELPSGLIVPANEAAQCRSGIVAAVGPDVSALEPGASVNIEAALRAGEPLGGHLVQGHVDALGHVVRRDPGDHWDVVTISLPAGLAPYLVDQGSITVDGVSLSVVEAGDESFTVSLIPVTLRRTTLGVREPGDPVNLEVDVIGKYVARQLAHLVTPEGTRS